MAGGSPATASTETLIKDVSTAWQQVADLPFATHGLRGIGLENGQFIVTGEDLTNFPLLISNACIPGGYPMRTDVLIYDSQTNQWTAVGHLSTGRRYHGISKVPRETADFCV